MERTVCVTGGRDYQDAARVFSVLDEIHAEGPIGTLVQGGASGADRHAANWAASRGVPCITEAADWKTHGRSAGPKRNRRMLETHRPAILVAFPGGRGTEHCVDTANELGIPVDLVAARP